MKKVSIVLFAALLSGCATSNAGKIRKEKPFTVGYAGLQIRPSENVGIGISGDVAEKEEHTCADSAGFCLDKDAKREIEYETEKYAEGSSKSRDFSAYINFFPYNDSAFFIGLGGVYKLRKSEVKLSETKETYQYQSEALYVRPALGWNWIWENGFSLFFDFGIPILTNSKQKLPKTDSSDAVQAAKFIDSEFYNKSSILRVGGGSGLIGWSFGF